ncbi:hypothetical protein Pfo_017065 [Paulownia fortunei]|nr:hypothetical protein Pfo_017065 [Paulownia fortunei]
MPHEDSKTVKKEEVEDEDDEKSIASAFPKRNNKSPNNSNATPKSQPKVKKEENKVKKEEADEDFEGPTSKKASNKIDNKGQKKKKKKKEEEAEKMKKKGGKTGNSKDVKKREKKVFDLPGQKRDPPEERDPLRIFYETLYKQVPASEMAAIWMMESGLLPKEEAKKVFDRKLKTAQQQKLSSPMKTVVTVKKRPESVTIEKKSATSPFSTLKKKTPASKVASKQSNKRKSKDESSEDDTDDDFVVDMKMPKKQRAS